MQKRAFSLSFFSFPHEQFYPEGLSIFAPFRQLKIWVAYTYSTEIQRLSSTSLNFQALFRLKFKDFQGVCDPCTTKGIKAKLKFMKELFSFACFNQQCSKNLPVTAIS